MYFQFNHTYNTRVFNKNVKISFNRSSLSFFFIFDDFFSIFKLSKRRRRFLHKNPLHCASHLCIIYIDVLYIRLEEMWSLRVCSHALINSWMSISITRWRYIIISKSISIFYSLNYSHSTHGKSSERERWCGGANTHCDYSHQFNWEFVRFAYIFLFSFHFLNCKKKKFSFCVEGTWNIQCVVRHVRIITMSMKTKKKSIKFHLIIISTCIFLKRLLIFLFLFNLRLRRNKSLNKRISFLVPVHLLLKVDEGVRANHYWACRQMNTPAEKTRGEM